MKIFLTLLLLLSYSIVANADVKTMPQPTFIVDTEAEKDTSWPDSLVFCVESGKFYELKSGAFIQLNMSIAPTFVTRSFNSAFQVSTTRPALVTYSVSITSTLSLSGGQSGIVHLETSPNNSTWTEANETLNANTGSLTIGLNTSQIGGGVLIGFVPSSYYVRLRTDNITGSPTYAYKSGQEMVL